MSTTRRDLVDAATLVRHALGRERPRTGSTYEQLLARYRTDTAYAETVAALCEGLGLYILGTSPTGLVVHGDGDGPFRVTLDNAGLNVRDPEHRFVYALVIAAVAAYSYRDADALADTAMPILRCSDLEKFLDRAVDRVAGDTDDAGTDDWDSLLGVAGRQWRERPGIHLTPQGRPKVGCHRWYTTSVLEWLADNQMAVRQPALADQDRGMAYQLTDRFRMGMAELAATDAFAVLVATPTTDDADDPGTGTGEQHGAGADSTEDGA